MVLLSFYLLALLAAVANASILTLQSPKVTISTSDATQLRSETLSLTQKPATPLALNPTDVLKLTFQIVDKDEGTGVKPHQTFLRFYDEASGEEGIQPVKVTSTGKAKFELNMSRPPLSLPPTSSPSTRLKTTLIIGSFTHSPLKIDLFDLVLPVSAPAPTHPDEPKFHLLPEIEHTFRPDQKLPPQFISAVFGGIVLGPWVILLGLWGAIKPSVPRLFSPHIAPFILSLIAFEALLVWYWVDLKLGQVLLYGGVLGIITAITGKNALATMADWRIGARK